MTTQEQDPFPPKGIDLERPSVARIYDWMLGGTANWAIDREFGEKAIEHAPLARSMAMANRIFLGRAVRYLAKRGVRQFVDIGSGVPTMGNTHQVADSVAPDSKVVYIDNEPVAVAHSQVLLDQHGDKARHAVVNADLRDPDRLWQKVAETGVVDLAEPLALLVIAVLHIQQPGPDGTDVGPAAIARYRKLLPRGSYLAISHGTDDGVPEEQQKQISALKQLYGSSSSAIVFRPRAEIRALFGDFELVPPGMSWTPDWHPEESDPEGPKVEFTTSNQSIVWAGVGRKP